MTNLEKWKRKLAEAEDAKDFFYQLDQMNDEIYEKLCYTAQEAIVIGCELDYCEECKARWLDKEVEE